MSLINQMLQDLQQQKKGGAQSRPEPPRRSVMDKIPYLPMPVVLSGAGLLLLALIWWMAGVLSDVMFGFEPAPTKDEGSQVVSVEESAAQESLNFAVEKDQLTLAEREAEPPAAPVVSEPVIATSEPPVKEEVEQSKPLIKVASDKATVPKPLKVLRESSPKRVKSQPVKASVRTAAKSRPQTTPLQAVAKAPKRLHPDELPGALRTPHVLTPAVKLVERPSRIPATTPYGMAEEAYLDGKWAYERERSNLAIRSLQDALELYPGHLPARELLVKIFRNSGKNGEAMFLLAEGLEIAPDYLAFKKSYARLLVDQGDYDAAINVLLKGGLPSVEEDPEAHVILASLYQRLGESFLAAQTYRNLLVAWPQTGAFWVGLGGALEGQNQPKSAVECYQKALQTKNLRKDLLAYAQKRLSVLN